MRYNTILNKNFGQKMFTIPTQLTLFRIVLIPVFVIAYYLPFGWGPWFAAGIFVVASFTDLLDGYLARRWNQTSAFGAFLDPVADKLMVTAALVMIVESYQNPAVSVAALIMIGREIVISALREWMAELGKRGKVAVNWMGKVKTMAQMVALTGLIANLSGGLRYTAIGLLYLAAVLTLVSMMHYLQLAREDLLSQEK